MNWMVRGGFVMWPLLALSILTLVVVVERVLFWRRERGVPARAALEGSLRSLELDRLDGPSIDAAIGAEQKRLERGMTWIDTVITAAPMLGILGTVLGIIDSFELLALEVVVDPLSMSGGVAQALITTATGLTIALCALFPFNFFRHRLAERLEELEREGRRMQSSLLSDRP
jgi:biopolymer transport protein ExbB